MQFSTFTYLSANFYLENQQTKQTNKKPHKKPTHKQKT